MPVFRTIMHPTDFSEHSDLAFHLAVSMARDYGARVVVVHVTAPPAAYYGEGVFPVMPAGEPDRLRDQLGRLVAQEPKVLTEHFLLVGDAATEILEKAEEVHCDLIVMGTHGRSGLDRLLMGSVAEQVVRKAPCPVLTVKLPTAVKTPRPKARAKRVKGDQVTAK